MRVCRPRYRRPRAPTSSGPPPRRPSRAAAPPVLGSGRARTPRPPAPAQGGGAFAPGQTRELVERLRGWGAVGVGQSSWGPAVYGISGDTRASRALAERARTLLGAAGVVYETGFSQAGARVWRG